MAIFVKSFLGHVLRDHLSQKQVVVAYFLNIEYPTFGVDWAFCYEWRLDLLRSTVPYEFF